MKQTTKGFVAGFLVCLFLSSTLVLASTGTKMLEATYRDIKLVVDGNMVTPKDSNGNIVEPFVVEGTTYLPVRSVGEALGKTVEWDGATSTVYIGAKTGGDNSSAETPVAQTAKLIDLKPTREERYGKEEMLKDKFGGVYRDCPALFDEGYVEFFLDKQYTKLTIIVAPDDEHFNVDAESILFIDGDSKNLYTSDAITYKTRPISIEVDVSGQDYITLTHKTNQGWTRLILGNATLSK